MKYQSLKGRGRGGGGGGGGVGKGKGSIMQENCLFPSLVLLFSPGQLPATKPLHNKILTISLDQYGFVLHWSMRISMTEANIGMRMKTCKKNIKNNNMKKQIKQILKLLNSY